MDGNPNVLWLRAPPCTCTDASPGCAGACTRDTNRVGKSVLQRQPFVSVTEKYLKLLMHIDGFHGVVERIKISACIDTTARVSAVSRVLVDTSNIPVLHGNNAADTVLLKLSVTDRSPIVTVRCIVVEPSKLLNPNNTHYHTPDVRLGLDAIATAQCKLESNVYC